MWLWFCIPVLSLVMSWQGEAAEILMITMGGTKSHKIPFWELARGLIQRDHNVTFVSAFPADFHIQGLEEVTPAGLIFYVRNYTNWDLVGQRMKGEEPLSVYDAFRYPYESCEALLDDHETKQLINTRKKYDLFILDGAFPECALGMVHRFKAPFMYINTVAFYTGSITNSGSPALYSFNPIFFKPYTNDMTFVERMTNTFWHLASNGVHYASMSVLHKGLKKHLGSNVPHPYTIGKDVGLVLHNGHYSVTYPSPFMPNVIEIACIHCKPPKPLSKDLEDFINEGGDSGFIFVSMGSSVKADNVPEDLRRLLVRTYSQLPYQVLWKWEDDANTITDLPHNVKLSKWLPQQDLLGHRKIRAFVTHGGLLSMFETVYHGVPVVSMPVFCDHDANAAKAVVDGYAIKLELHGLTSEILVRSINSVIQDPKYRDAVKRKQILLKDQKETPLERAIFWTEYAIRHKGAKHLLSPARNMNFVQYYSIDSIGLWFIILLFICSFVWWLLKASLRYIFDHYTLNKTKHD